MVELFESLLSLVVTVHGDGESPTLPPANRWNGVWPLLARLDCDDGENIAAQVIALLLFVWSSLSAGWMRKLMPSPENGLQ